MGFPDNSAGKESACNAGDLGLIPGLGRSPGEGKGYPLQYSGLESSKKCIVHGVAESRTRLSDFHFHNSVKLLFKMPPFGFLAFPYYLFTSCFTDSCLTCITFFPCTWSLLACVHAKLLQLCLTLSSPRDCNPPASSVHGISQARILEWVACPPGDLPNPGIQPASPRSPALAGGFFTTRATWGGPHGVSSGFLRRTLMSIASDLPHP